MLKMSSKQGVQNFGQPNVKYKVTCTWQFVAACILFSIFFSLFFAILTKLFLKASFIAFNAMCTLQSYKSDDSISAKSISINNFSEFVRGFLQFACPL